MRYPAPPPPVPEPTLTWLALALLAATALAGPSEEGDTALAAGDLAAAEAAYSRALEAAESPKQRLYARMDLARVVMDEPERLAARLAEAWTDAEAEPVLRMHYRVLLHEIRFDQGRLDEAMDLLVLAEADAREAEADGWLAAVHLLMGQAHAARDEHLAAADAYADAATRFEELGIDRFARDGWESVAEAATDAGDHERAAKAWARCARVESEPEARRTQRKRAAEAWQRAAKGAAGTPVELELWRNAADAAEELGGIDLWRALWQVGQLEHAAGMDTSLTWHRFLHHTEPAQLGMVLTSLHGAMRDPATLDLYAHAEAIDYLPATRLHELRCRTTSFARLDATAACEAAVAAWDAAGEPASAAWSALRLADARLVGGQPEAALAAYADALARPEDPAAPESQSLLREVAARFDRTFPDQRTAFGAELGLALAEAAERAGQPARAAWAHLDRSIHLVTLGELEAASQALERAASFGVDEPRFALWLAYYRALAGGAEPAALAEALDRARDAGELALLGNVLLGLAKQPPAVVEPERLLAPGEWARYLEALPAEHAAEGARRAEAALATAEEVPWAAHIAVGAAYFRAELWAPASEAFARAAASEEPTERAEALLRQADCAMAQEREDESLALFREAAALDSNPRTQWFLAEACARAGAASCAREAYTVAHELALAAGDRERAGRASTRLGWDRAAAGDELGARRLYERAIAELLTADAPEAEGEARLSLGIALRLIGSVDDSVAELEAAVERLDGRVSADLLAALLLDLGRSRAARQDLAGAVDSLDRALRQAEAAGLDARLPEVLAERGLVRTRQDELPLARKDFARALEAYTAVGQADGAEWARARLAELEEGRDAVALREAQLAEARASGESAALAAAEDALGSALLAAERFDEAEAALREALRRARREGDALRESRLHLRLADTHVLAGDARRAMRLAGRAQRAARRAGDRIQEGWSLHAEGVYARQDTPPDAARATAALDAAMALFTEIEHRAGEKSVHEARGQLAHALGEAEAAEAHLARATALATGEETARLLSLRAAYAREREAWDEAVALERERMRRRGWPTWVILAADAVDAPPADVNLLDYLPTLHFACYAPANGEHRTPCPDSTHPYDRATQAMRAGDWPAASAALDEAMAMAEAEADTALHAAVWWARAGLAWNRGRFTEAAASLEALMATAELDDPLQALAAPLARGMALARAGHLEPALVDLRRAHALATAHGDAYWRFAAALSLAGVLDATGGLDEASQVYAEAIAQAEASESSAAIALAHVYFGAHQSRARWTSLPLASYILALQTLEGDPRASEGQKQLGMLAVNTGYTLFSLRSWAADDAVDNARDAVRDARALSRRGDVLHARALLVRALLARGDVAEADVEAEGAVEEARGWDHAAGLVETLEVRAEVHLRLGAYPEALSALDEADALRATHDLQLDRPRGLALRGDAHRGLSAWGAAREAYLRAIDLAAASGDATGELVARSRYAGWLLATGEVPLDETSALLELAPTSGLYDRAVPVVENLLGMTELTLGNTDAALQSFERAAARFAEVEEHAGEALAVLRTGVTLQVAGRHDEAARVLATAWRLSRERGLEELEWKALDGLRTSKVAVGEPDTGILFGKMAVDVLQGLQGRMGSLSPEQQALAREARGDAYRGLADLLITRGRLPEAEQVLGMLKEDELSDYLRSASEEAARTTRTPAESRAVDAFASAERQALALGAERGALLARLDAGEALAEADLDRLDSLDLQLAEAEAAFLDSLRVLREEVIAAGGERAVELGERNLEDAVAMQDVLAGLGEGVVLVHTIATRTRLHLIVTTSEAQVARTVSVHRSELDEAVRALREAVRSPATDVLPAAQALYAYLLRPLEADLAAAGAKTILWSLDGSLRYVPIAALHDGERFAVERWHSVLYTPAADAALSRPPAASWSVAALGVSRAHGRFSALPSVPAELDAIVRADETDEGVLPGIVHLDEAFTADSLRETVRTGRYPVVHIASHFSFAPGAVDESYLLLGDGGRLTVAELSTGFRFRGVELLALSACDTAMGEAADGREVEGFGTQAQRKGARAVLATLWPVADPSTKALMAELYRLRAEEGLGKAAALSEAQRRLLGGQIAATGEETERGLLDDEDEDEDAPPDWTHPYYWAPFVLFGNFL